MLSLLRLLWKSKGIIALGTTALSAVDVFKNDGKVTGNLLDKFNSWAFEKDKKEAPDNENPENDGDNVFFNALDDTKNSLKNKAMDAVGLDKETRGWMSKIGEFFKNIFSGTAGKMAGIGAAISGLIGFFTKGKKGALTGALKGAGIGLVVGTIVNFFTKDKGQENEQKNDLSINKQSPNASKDFSRVSGKGKEFYSNAPSVSPPKETPESLEMGDEFATASLETDREKHGSTPTQNAFERATNAEKNENGEAIVISLPEAEKSKDAKVIPLKGPEATAV